MDARSRAGHGLALLTALLLAAVALAPPAPGASKRRPAPKLSAFDSCGSLVSYARRNARRVGGGRGVPSRARPFSSPSLPGFVPTREGDFATSPQPAAAAPQSGASEGGGGGTGGPDFSETNNQEAGVDEPDVVKTDGRRIFAVADGVLRATVITDGVPRVAGGLELEGFDQQLLLRGNRVLVMASVPGPSGVAATMLTEVDVTDPAAMAVRRTLRLDGSLVDSRMTGGTARVVVVSAPRPIEVSDLPEAGVRTWVPRTVLRSRVSGRTFRRSVVPCDDVRHPRAFSGLDLLTVFTVDLDQGLYSVDRDAIMAGAETVYASPTSLYVASRRYSPGVPSGVRTEIHRFDTSKPDATTYRSSGEVEGYVLNQYSMSEHDGALRVATTSEPEFLPQDNPESTPERQSESAVTVLSETKGRLNRVGRVGGLGRGEQIYSVRFVEDKGYVVTFRQTDPLYTLDLADPKNPKLLGELKILGYSAYLHPVTDDLLLGVGQDATEQGQRKGSQLSLFDVSDLRAPKRVAQADLGRDSSSTAEFDPHAFLYWRPSALAAIPLVRYGRSEEDTFVGVVGFRVGRDALSEAGQIEHPRSQGAAPAIGRSLVIGDRLFTVSVGGVAANRLDGALAGTGFAEFPRAR